MDKLREWIVQTRAKMSPEDRQKLDELSKKYRREDEDALLAKLKVGDLLECTEDYNNTLGWPLCIEGQEYKVLDFDLETRTVMVNHIIYANEHVDWSIETIIKHFRYVGPPERKD